MRVFIKIDDKNRVIAINSEIFISDLTGWTQIDDGVGDRYAHAQGNYFPKSLTDENGVCRYKYADGIVSERTAEEIEIELFPSIISNKKSELSTECEKAIISGVDVGEVHYSLTIEDQANILAWMAVAQTGKSVPYHCDGQPCRIYSSEEFMEIANAAVACKTHHTTYCNLLMRQVEAMTDIDDVKAVQYGITQLDGEYAEQYQIIMASLVGDNGETNN